MTEILGVVVLFVPLFVIAWVANLAEARRARGEAYNGMALVAYIFLIVMYAGAFLFGLLAQFVALMQAANPAMFEAAIAEFPADSLSLLAVGLWLPSLLGIILLMPPVRRWIARFTALDPESPVHAVALALSMLVITNLLITLGVGIGTFADMMAEQQTPSSGDTTMAALWTQQILTALLAMVGVGWLTRRNLGETLERLALRIPTGREWGIAIGVGLLMVPVVLGIEILSGALGIGADADVERLTEQLLGALFTTPLGILTIGLSAGLGEETLFRGALLPRFGLIASSVFFALVHSNYGITLSTLVVLILGLLLGWLRLRYNTTTAMITHAVYNMTLGLIAYFSAGFIDF